MKIIIAKKFSVILKIYLCFLNRYNFFFTIIKAYTFWQNFKIYKFYFKSRKQVALEKF